MYMQIYISKTYSIDMGMQKESTAGKCSKDVQHGNTACACSMYSTCCTDMQHGGSTGYSMYMQH